MRSGFYILPETFSSKRFGRALRNAQTTLGCEAAQCSSISLFAICYPNDQQNKKSPLRDRLFSQLCEGNDEEFNLLLLYTEVRWLPRGLCLNRFYQLFQTVLQFFESADVELWNNLKKRRGDIAYLSDLYFKFNETNSQLQVDDLNLIKTKNVISAFVAKLLLFKQNLAHGEFYQFPNVGELKKTDSIPDNDVHVYFDNEYAAQGNA
ncbi:hypothetical protein M514_05746 [Trichuris suis]|uniref:Uncharacterized protein n=1 Tax=Trichuris suis TaxID=68888 RepID=A0A085M7R9_9BILA|nr:hypothetical protein M513_05746 [Trichuris suis]KFD66346.1 hypothetical protein M514_05746 [Trichuris suis]